MNCRYCGSRLIDDARFCTNCGRKIENVQTNGYPGTASSMNNINSPKVPLTCEYCGCCYDVDPNYPPVICIACGAKLPAPKSLAQIAMEKQKSFEIEEKKKKESERREADRKIMEQIEKARVEEKRLTDLKQKKKEMIYRRIKICCLVIFLFIVTFFGIHLYTQVNNGSIRGYFLFDNKTPTNSSIVYTKTSTPKPTIIPQKTPTRTVVYTLTSMDFQSAGETFLRPTDTRCPTLTLRPTDTRWPTLTPQPTDTPWPTLTSKPIENNAEDFNNNEINPDLKNYLDSYEAYVDEYISFMKSYNENDIILFVKYFSFLEKLDELARNGEKWESNMTVMSNADKNYYLTTMNRINTKLIQAGQ